MNTKRHIIGLLISFVLISVFQYIGAAWSWADFHPGGDVDVPESDRRIARIGSAMTRPFTTPTMWLMSITGGYSTFMGITRWLLLPVCYGAILYGVFFLIRCRCSSQGAQAT